jgi:DNA-binding transcriptional LysR family regulator
MGFDDDVDAARQRLRASLEDTGKDFDQLAALQAVLPKILQRLQSRRLSFVITNEPEEGPAITIAHTVAQEELGFVMAEDGEYLFESALDDYFDDFVDEDADSFVSRLYETLKADLPKYEVETDVA